MRCCATRDAPMARQPLASNSHANSHAISAATHVGCGEASAATGDLDSLTSYVVAATEAQLATQITVAVRNKAVDAFNQIMGMPI